MQKVILNRTKTGPNGTEGWLTFDGHIFQTLELQEANNQPDVSCIPAGDYVCSVRPAPHLFSLFGYNPYEVLDVKDRVGVFIHPANWAGDKSKGLKCDLLGCIGLGTDHAVIDGQPGIINSRFAVAHFMGLLGKADFQLTINDIPAVTAETV